ncbi:hypothetical protein [Agaribacterium sp. ZY112]|uniref:hypothetical protein n=1 Tax=Agaribacterium sp. ZY112 TaxID=3233574 RepID=UPI00352320C8
MSKYLIVICLGIFCITAQAEVIQTIKVDEKRYAGWRDDGEYDKYYYIDSSDAITVDMSDHNLLGIPGYAEPAPNQIHLFFNYHQQFFYQIKDDALTHTLTKENLTATRGDFKGFQPGAKFVVRIVTKKKDAVSGMELVEKVHWSGQGHVKP